jgi:predicted NBD/HSP70 family sugar kinase
MMAEVHRRSIIYRATNTRIEKAMLGNEAGLFGAAYLARSSPSSVRA